MESWIRYSVAVYVGLLLAGAAIYPNDVQIGPAASADTPWYQSQEKFEYELQQAQDGKIEQAAPPAASAASVSSAAADDHDR